MWETFVYTRAPSRPRQWATLLLRLRATRGNSRRSSFSRTVGLARLLPRPRTREKYASDGDAEKCAARLLGDRREKCRPRKRYLVGEGSSRNSQIDQCSVSPDTKRDSLLCIERARLRRLSIDPLRTRLFFFFFFFTGAIGKVIDTAMQMFLRTCKFEHASAKEEKWYKQAWSPNPYPLPLDRSNNRWTERRVNRSITQILSQPHSKEATLRSFLKLF